jgi:hypothetical protein
MDRQRPQDEDISGLGVDCCELVRRQQSEPLVRNDTPQVAASDQLKSARALVGSVKVQPKRYKVGQKFRRWFALGFTTAHAGAHNVTIGGGNHPILMCWDGPIGGLVLVEQGRIDQHAGCTYYLLRQ